MNDPPKIENDDLRQRSASSSSQPTNDKLRAFAEAREKANAQSRELGPSLRPHLVVIVAGLVVIASWAARIALRAF